MGGRGSPGGRGAMRRRVGAVVLLVAGAAGPLTVTAAPSAATSARSASAATEVASPSPVVLDQGSAHSCAIVGSGQVKCWGYNQSGQLGLGNVSARGDGPDEMGRHLPAVALGTGRSATSLAVGDEHTCAVLDDGSVKCWGFNSAGQLGIGTFLNRGDIPNQMGDNLPVAALGTGRTAIAVTAGFRYSCALLDNGQVKCWGYNNEGQLGQGDTTYRGDNPGEMGDSLLPIPLGTGRTATAVSGGANHVCAVLDNGQVKCWGYNAHGQLGVGDTAARGDNPGEMGDNLPAVALGNGRTATAVSAGFGHTCALLDNGAVKCWGFNGDGRLGLGGTNNRGDGAGEMGDNLPSLDLGTGRTATAVDAGDGHICALLDNGSVKCWGVNASGQLGLGDTTTRGTSLAQMGDNLPAVSFGSGQPATMISAGSSTCARLDDGTFRCWGLNHRGQLGLGDTVDRGDGPGEMGASLPPTRVVPTRSITIVLDTGTDTSQDFAFTGCSGPTACGDFSLDRDDDPTLPSSTSMSLLAVGSYTVTAAAVPQWAVTAISCDSGGTVDLPARKVTILLGSDDDITCTFSVRTASITIVQDTVPDLAQDLSFTGCMGQGCSTFALDDDGDPTLPRSVSGVGLAPGTYTITQASLGANWPLLGVTCNVPETVDLANRRVTIALAAGENVTCTFQTKPTLIRIVQDTTPDNAQDFAFTGCNAQAGCSPFTLDDDSDATTPGTLTAPGLDPGTYTVTQAAVPKWALTGITCDAGGTGDVANARATIALTAGQQVTCTFQDAARPVNDALRSATNVIFVGHGGISGVPGTTRYATKEPGEPEHAARPGGESVWFRFQSEINGPVRFSTCSPSTTFDTAIAVYTGPEPASMASLTPVGGNDDALCWPRAGSSTVTVNLNQGPIYWIAVDNVGSTPAGEFSLYWQNP